MFSEAVVLLQMETNRAPRVPCILLNSFYVPPLQPSRACCREASAQHDAPTTVFPGGDGAGGDV